MLEQLSTDLQNYENFYKIDPESLHLPVFVTDFVKIWGDFDVSCVTPFKSLQLLLLPHILRSVKSQNFDELGWEIGASAKNKKSVFGFFTLFLVYIILYNKKYYCKLYKKCDWKKVKMFIFSYSTANMVVHMCICICGVVCNVYTVFIYTSICLYVCIVSHREKNRV